MNVEKYLDRLGLERYKPELTVECLNTLLRAHISHIAYENLDAWLLKKAPDLDIDVVYNKIIEQKRGGWCHELNGLFCAFLKEIGFNVYSTGARLFIRGEVTAMGHRCTICEIDGVCHYCDVGYGSLFLMNAVPFDGSVTPYGFSIEKQDRWHYVMLNGQKAIGFVDMPFEPQDFRFANYFDAKAPGQFFNETLYATILDGEDRLEFKGDVLSRKSGDVKTVICETSDINEKLSLLEKYFNIETSGIELT